MRIRRTLSVLQIRIVSARWSPAPKHQRPVDGAERDAEHDCRRQPEAARCQEPLDEPREHEPRRGAEHDLDGDAGLGRERGAAPAVAGADERPSHPQAGRARDYDARQLEHAVRGHELEERLTVAGPDRQARDRSEQHALIHEEHGGTQAGGNATRERDQGHPDVVGEDLARERRLLVGREAQVGPALTGLGHRAVLRRHDPARRAGVAHGPHGGQDPGSEQQQRRDEQQPGPLAHAAPVPRHGELQQRSAATDALVHERAGAGDERLETGNHRVAGKSPAGEREIGRARPVERAEAANTVGPERLGPAPGAPDQRVELLPPRPPLAHEDVEIQSVTPIDTFAS